MKPEELANFQPSWKTIPNPPTRLPVSGEINAPSCNFEPSDIRAEITAEVDPPDIPEPIDPPVEPEEVVLPNLYTDLATTDTGQAVSVTYGVVMVQHMLRTGGEPLAALVPKLGDIAIDSSPPPTIPAQAGTLYVHVETDPRGNPDGDPVIEFGEEDQTSIHHRPPDAINDPVNGDYWFPIAVIETIGESLVVTKRNCGNLYIPNQLVQFENLGGANTSAEEDSGEFDGVARVYYAYQDGLNGDKHQLRTLAGRGNPRYEGDGPQDGTTEQIKVVEDGDQIRAIGNGKTKKLRINLPDSSYHEVKWNDGLVDEDEDVTVNIPAPPDPPEYPTIPPLEGRGEAPDPVFDGDVPPPQAGTTQQIQVVDDAGTNRILGNGRTKKLTFTFEGEDLESDEDLNWNDGLVTRDTDLTIEIPKKLPEPGSSGNVLTSDGTDWTSAAPAFDGNDHTSTLTFEDCDGNPLVRIAITNGLAVLQTFADPNWVAASGDIQVAVEVCPTTT